jgi:ribosomal protein L31
MIERRMMSKCSKCGKYYDYQSAVIILANTDPFSMCHPCYFALLDYLKIKRGN